jgi:hypothetical protein
MPSRSPSHPLGAALSRAALAVALLSTVACGRGGASVAPSALAANPSNYDGQTITVTGTAKNPTAHQMRRGTATTYQLCDSACINVVQFGDTNVADGSQVTVSGRFRESFGRRQMMTNVLVVGGRFGGEAGGEAAPSPSQ